MSASKDKDRGTWIVYIRYKDWKGESQVHKKRGFVTKREALEYERQFLVKKSKDLNMPFPDFVDIYMSDIKPRIKYNTYRSKEYIIRDKILPYFKNFSVSSITAPDIVQWQNELLQFRDSEEKILYRNISADDSKSVKCHYESRKQILFPERKSCTEDQ